MELDALLREWDGETVVTHFDHPTGAWMVIAIHSTRRGPACGGTRMKNYPDLASAAQDALRLAAGMTFKFAAADFEMGGGKAVIALPPSFDSAARGDLLRRYGALVHQLSGLYYTGPDVGTSSVDMDIIAETGAPYVFARTPRAGGAGDSGPITGLGVFHGLRATCKVLDGTDSLAGKRVLVQGLGSVGRTLAGLLRGTGAVVSFNDVDPAAVRHGSEELGLQLVPAESLYETACDFFSPCALGGILNEDTIPRLNCRAVVGAANNQLATPQDADRLRERGILYAPDYICNLGGAMGITGIEALGWTRAEAEQRVIDAVTRTLGEVFALAQRDNISTDAAARHVVEGRLSQAESRSRA